MNTYVELTTATVGTRVAAGLRGIPRSTATRPHRTGLRHSRRRPVNRLSITEPAQLVEVLTSDRFVDQTPLQFFATLFNAGTQLWSIFTM